MRHAGARPSLAGTAPRPSPASGPRSETAPRDKYRTSLVLRAAFMADANTTPSLACVAELQQQTSRGSCHFGCADGHIWVRPPCHASFICEGTQVICLAQRKLHLMQPDGTTRCACRCPGPPVRPWPSSQPSPPTGPVSEDGACSTEWVYQRGPLEDWWLRILPRLQETSIEWPCGCRALRAVEAELHAWIRAYGTRQHRVHVCGPSPLDGRLPEAWLSYHSVMQHCPGRAAVEVRRVPIEPLVGFLRNPTFMLKFCASSKSYTHVVRPLVTPAPRT